MDIVENHLMSNQNKSYKQGWLTKEGGIIKSWKKRWFVLTETDLVYYTKANGVEKGRIPLDGTTVDFAKECKTQPAFKIVTEKRTYYIVGNSDNDVKLWVKAIRNVQKGKMEFVYEASDSESSYSYSSSYSVKKPTPDDTEQKDEGTPATEKQQRLENMIPIKTISKSSFGTVTLVKFSEGGKQYLSKTINKNKFKSKEQEEEFRSKMIALKDHPNPFVLQITSFLEDEDHFYAMMDHINGIEFYQVIDDTGALHEVSAIIAAAEVLIGLTHLHSIGIYQLDISPENIVVDQKGHIKLTDVGLHPSSDEHISYIAPEILQNQGDALKAADWWAFGALIYEMLAGVAPFRDSKEDKARKKVLTAPLSIPLSVGQEASDLLSKLLKKDPNDRLGKNDNVEEIQKHPFFKDVEWDKVKNLEVPSKLFPKYH